MRSTEFANYKLLDRLEAAPLGELYKAYNYDTRDIVSLLLLPDEFRDLKDFEVKRTLGDLLETADAKLTHHGLVHLIHVGCRQGKHYVEMEFVRGKTLAQHVEDKGPSTPEDVIRVLRCVAEALEVAHSKSVVHRAVSPYSILLLEDGEAKLGNFGMARLVVGLRKYLGRKADKLLTGPPVLDEKCLSPEQREGSPGDERSDIYGLGATMFFMLKTRRPTDMSEFPALGSAPPIYELIRRMMNPDHRKRIQSGEAVLMALDHLDELAAGELPSAVIHVSKPPEQKLPLEVGGDPSDTLLWDTNQLDVLRSKWVEDKPFPEFQDRAHPVQKPRPPSPEGEDAAASHTRTPAREVGEGYQPAFQALVVDDVPKESFEQRNRDMALARKRANIQLIFGIALNLVLFLIALKLALPLIEKYRTGSSGSAPEQAGPREYGEPAPAPSIRSTRPVVIPRESGQAPQTPAPTEGIPTESGTPAAKPVQGAREKKAPLPSQAEPGESRPAPTPKPGLATEGQTKEPAATQPLEKDPMKADFMKDEPFSYYQDPDWAKKGKGTVRIVIPDWQKKRAEMTEKEKQEEKSGAKKSKKDTREPAEPAEQPKP